MGISILLIALIITFSSCSNQTKINNSDNGFIPNTSTDVSHKDTICKENCPHQLGMSYAEETIKYIARPLSDENIKVFMRQAEIISDHIVKYLISGLFLEESKTIYPKDLQDGSIWNFVMNSYKYYDYEVHPYNDFCSYSGNFFSMSEENAQTIVLELFNRPYWCYKKDDTFYWCSKTNTIVFPNNTGGITNELILDNIKTNLEGNVISVSFSILRTNTEMDIYNELISNTSITYEILTEDYAGFNGKTFLRLVNVDHKNALNIIP